MRTQAHTPDQLIQEYCAAYVKANSYPAPQITYAKGWFTIRSSRSGSYGAKSKYRRHAIERFRDALLDRAKARAGHD